MGDPLTITIRNLVIEPEFGAPFLASVRAGEVWRLVTPMFIHFGVLHLLFNMSGVWRFARQVEHQQGHLFLLALVLWTQIPGIVGQYALAFVMHQNSVIGGMSGVLYGLFGYVWMQARFNRKYAYFIDEPTTWLMMIWFVLCTTGLIGPVANVAHAAGLMMGLMMGLPGYVLYLRARAANPEFKEHSWADVHIRGKTRVYRQFLAPYVPLWLLVIAAVAIALDR
jgi:GlpG protein